jgi:LPS export ABC transporter protein LptC
MSVNLRNLALFAALAGVAAATWLLSRQPEAPEPVAASAEPGPRGYFLEEAVLIGTNESGHILFRAHVDRVEKLVDDDDFRLEGIRIEYVPDSGIRWQLTANRGSAPFDLAFFDLEDGVRMSYGDVGGGSEALVETAAVHLDARQSIAVTYDPISFQWDKAEANAVGLEANLVTDSLVLNDVTVRTRR